jgi:betaine lipid synthase
MGKGGEGRQVQVKKDGLLKRISSSGKLKRISSVADDLLVLKSIWFNKASGDDHAERLENFYGPQAAACALPSLTPLPASACACEVLPFQPPGACCADDNFRSKFLWGRKPMLAACAARLAEKNDLVWVDLGGGTGVRSTAGLSMPLMPGYPRS